MSHLTFEMCPPTIIDTLTVWEEIRDPIVDFIEERKEQYFKWHLIAGRLDLFNRAFAKIPNPADNKTSHPRPVDLTVLKDVRAVLEHPADIEVSEPELRAMMPTFIALWREHVRARLAELAMIVIPESVHVIPDLYSIARLTFKCSCGHLVLAAQATEHVHSRPSTDYCKLHWGTICPNAESTYETAVLFRYRSRRAWSARALGLRARGTRTKEMFAACGVDAVTATCAEMDKLDMRLECRWCRQPGRSRAIMDWREAVRPSSSIPSSLT